MNKQPVSPIRKLSEAPPEQLFQAAGNYIKTGQYQEAAKIYRSLLQKDPNNHSGWLNLGTALRCLGLLDAAAACAKRSLDLLPDQPSALTNYGNCLVDLDRKEEALAAHTAAARLKPNDFLIQRNYAIALRDFGHLEQAIQHFDKALNLQPDDIQTQWDRAVTYLHLGRFEKGWKAFEIRWQLGKLRERPCNAPRWNGEPLQGKSILVFEEQGFGDSILCSRYMALIAQQGGRIILECKKPLHKLFQNLPGIIEITETGHYNGEVDYHIPMMSLPSIFRTDAASIPPAGHLAKTEKLPPTVNHLLSLSNSRLKVGIVWSGSVTFANNKKRAASLDRFLPFAEIPNVQLYSLQKGPREKDLTQHGAEGLIYDLAPYLDDFATTASILEKLDLVIMTDSSVAHLAGSLGRPIWNLLGSRPYWLYLKDREDTPWYPSMKLFRQDNYGDWDSVFKKAHAELTKLAQTR